jgi:hypothetical protein
MPGVYVPTPITVASTWPNVRPFQFRQTAGLGSLCPRDKE